MAESKYQIIEKEEPDINTDPDDEDDEEEEDECTEQFDDDTVTIITTSNNESHSIHPNKFNDVDIMRTPAAILALILVYFAFSIGLTFYQRSLLKVSIDLLFPFRCGEALTCIECASQQQAINRTNGENNYHSFDFRIFIFHSP